MSVIGDIGNVIAARSLSPLNRVGAMAWVSGDVYAIVGSHWEDDADRGVYVKTVSITSGGQISTVIATKLLQARKYSTGQGIVRRAGNVFCVSFLREYWGWQLYTLTINDDGTIGDVINTLQTHATTDLKNARKGLLYLDNDVVVVLTESGTESGHVFTIGVQSDGTITGQLDSDGFSADGRMATVRRIGTNIIAITFAEGSGNDGDITTYHVDLTTGALTHPAGPYTIVLNNIGDSGCAGGDMVHISGDVWACFIDADEGGWVATFTIDDETGLLPLDFLNEYKYRPGKVCSYGNALYLAGDVYAVVHFSLAGDIQLETVHIEDDGTIGSVQDTKVVDSDGFWSVGDFIKRADGVYVMAARKQGGDVYLESIEIQYTDVPTLTTDPATGVGVASATLNGTLDNQGIASCECGFEWGLDTGYGATTATQTKETGETFSQALAGLQPNTTYHFRAFATNSAGTSYGADRSFTTALVITRAYALARQEL